MKILFCILLIHIVINVKCDYSETGRRLPRMHRNIKIFNPRKFSKLRTSDSRKTNIKNTHNDNIYTVFSPISSKVMDVPNSPYFNVEPNGGYKPRIKKVLTDLYGHSIRKRSVRASNDTVSLSRRAKSVNSKLHKREHTHGHSKTSVHKKKKKSSKHHRHHKRHHMMDAPKTKGSLTRNLRNKQRVDKTNDSRKISSKSKHVRPKGKELRPEYLDKTLRLGKVRNRRLIAAKDAMIEDYPYVVSVQKASEHWCAGALLNPRLVITTANCIWKSNRVSRLKVRAGSRYVERGGQVARVQEVMRHPYWSIRKNPDYDVGLLYLDRNIRFSDKVHSVDLPNQAMLPAFEDAWVTSWGAERRDGVFENKGNTLQVFHARLLDMDKCNNVTQRFGVAVTVNFICLAQTGRRAPCTRDSGAPAVSDGILWGLASWGLRKLCGTERYPAMFSYLGSRSNIDFITNATHYLMSDQRHYPFADIFVLNKADTTRPPTARNLEY